MIIDFHTHIFPKSVREKREACFSDEPGFELLYKSLSSKLVGVDDLIRSMDEHHVDISVIFGFPWKNPDRIKSHNDYIMNAVARFPRRLVGFCCFDAGYEESALETERCFVGGLSGVGELAFYTSEINEIAIKQLRPVMEICRDNNAPVLIHTNEPVGHSYPGKTPNSLTGIYNLVKAFPENKIVLAHWGGGLFFFNLLKKEVKEVTKNVYLDTAATPFLYDPQIYRFAQKLAGLEKILFGSDFPLIEPGRYFKEIKEAELSDEEIKGICGENAARLLNLL